MIRTLKIIMREANTLLFTPDTNSIAYVFFIYLT